MPERTELIAAIKSIRHFNRYYTNRLGLLSRYRFDTEFTLTEARVILEIARRGIHTQSALNAELKIDGGYLSRVVKRLATDGLVTTRKGEEDGRVLMLELTDEGRRAAEEIDRGSDSEVQSLMEGLGPEETAALVSHLREAERILERRRDRAPVVESVTGGPGIATVRVLMREYCAFLGADLSFQHFEDELAGLPGKYAPPDGALFLASMELVQGGAEPAGCVALRKMDEGICEMKRLFVRPEYRGSGIGRVLAERVVVAAKDLGYRRMRLDTLERLGEAVGLYRAMGFVPIEPYYENPLPGAMFWEKELGC
jgi:DNA-binding MarR family transcriptional regulator/predicted GNAT family acetyltransferase